MARTVYLQNVPAQTSFARISSCLRFVSSAAKFGIVLVFYFCVTDSYARHISFSCEPILTLFIQSLSSVDVAFGTGQKRAT